MGSMLIKNKELNNMTKQEKNTMLEVKDLVDIAMKGRMQWNVAKADYYFDLAFIKLETELGLDYKQATPIINKFISESKEVA